MKRLARRILVTFLGLYLLTFATAGGGLLWLRSSLPRTGGTVILHSPEKAVEIIRDSNAVAHIFADSLHDAYFALGYVHAQDRLWQMEMTRRFGAGRLSEVFGKATVRADRYARILGLYRLAEKQAETAGDAMRAALEAYADGVNAYIEHREFNALPPEFVAMRLRPERWRPADSLVWSRIMAMRLSKNWYDELERLRLSRILPKERIDELWPDDPPESPLTLPPPERNAALQAERLLAAIPESFHPVDASNAWVLDGTRTATGKPILANDPHLGFTAPNLWYLVRIVTPEGSLVGATVPGVPLLVLGHNGKIAWGITSTGADTQDLFLERTDPADPARYFTPDGVALFSNRTEVIEVRDADPVAQIVRTSRHGPVITDLLDRRYAALRGGPQITLSTPALREDDRTPWGLFRINRAARWEDFIAAAEDFHAPYQNLFFADTSGDIGFIAAGRLPERKIGDGRMPVDGSKAEFDWEGYVPFDDLPKGFNPLSGLFANANNRLVGPSYRYLITRDWEPSYRAERIADVLENRGGLTMIDSQRLQMDTVSPTARQLLPLMLSLSPNTPLEERALNALKTWDLRMDRDRPEPAIYARWLYHLHCDLIRDKSLPKGQACGAARPLFVANVLTRATHWCDNLATVPVENCQVPLREALHRTLTELREKFGPDMADWRWGALHQAVFRHRLFDNIPGLAALGDRRIETSGGDNTLNRGQSRPGASPDMPHVHGSGYRAVYDLSNLDNSRFMIALGQSGNPLSPHYDDLLSRWRDGVYIRITGDRDALRRQAKGVLILKQRPKIPDPAPDRPAAMFGTEALP